MDEKYSKPDYGACYGKYLEDFSGKIEQYGKPDDFKAQSELTVTITLHEYRDLVSDSGYQLAKRAQMANELNKLRDENKNMRDLLEKTAGKLIDDLIDAAQDGE